MAASWIIAALLGTTPVAAKREEVICLASLHLWSGSNEDNRRIATVPVPDSYRQQFDAQPCNYLHKPSLVEWHLRYGDERSTTAALAFLEERLASIPPAAFMSKLAPAWAAALPCYRAAAPLRQDPDGNDRWLDRLDRDPAVRAIRPLAAAHTHYVLLAGTYLMAAEFYRSAALLEKARFYLAPAAEGVRVFHNDVSVGMARQEAPDTDLALFERYIDDVADAEQRVAVLRAIIERTPEAVSAAREALDTPDAALLRRAAEEAYEHGDDICDIDDREDLSDIRRACDEENNFEGRLLAYTEVRARLSLVSDGDPRTADQSVGAAFKLLRRAGDDENASSAWSLFPSDAIVDLLLLQAEADARAPGRTPEERRSGALGRLAYAASLTPPALHPGRFRQVAERFRATAGDGPLSDQEARTAAQLERTLADLPAIAVGARLTDGQAPVR